MATAPRLTLPVRAINDAARQDPAAVTRLTQAAQRVKAAQLGRRGGELPKATEAYRAALSHVEERAVASLEAGGRRVTSALRMRIRRTLSAAAADSADRAALERGRLAHEIAPSGFDVFGPTTRALRLLPRTSPSPPPPARSAPVGSTAGDDSRRGRAQQQVRLRTAVTTARTRLQGLETRARALERAAARHAARALSARQRAEEARQAADAAAAAVQQARTDLAAAEAQLRENEPPA